ncbi:MAG: hypothetical protein P9X26_07350 [Candidatus Stygibacter frigidus]|nr:hypothetical protein [Candidatus Stygibacter frigidus]
MDYKKLIASLKTGIAPELERELRLGRELSISRLQKLRTEYSDLPIHELLDHYELQQRARRKFTRAEHMVFTANGVEQSSSEIMGKYHNHRAGKASSLADLCCGVGGDLQYLAENRQKVYGVDLDSDSLKCAEYNCRVYENISYLQEKAENFSEKVELIFCDPDRRPQGNRKYNVEDMSPDLGQVLDLFFEKKLCGGILIKLSPVINYKKIENDYFSNWSKYATQWYSWEFISEDGVLKEILLCVGSHAERLKRKAVILPAAVELSGSGTEQIETKGWQSYIFEPDKSIIRAGLVQKLGADLDYQLLDEHLALLTGEQAVAEKYGKLFKLIEVMPYNIKKMQKYLREHEVGELVLKTRGFPDPVEKIHKKFKLKGNKKMIMQIVRLGEGHQVAVLERD